MNALAARHALVTGANRGIGAAIARALSAAGANVTLMVRDAAKTQEVAASLAGRHLVVEADVTDRAASQAACARAAAHFGPIDILVNNAGTAENAPFLKLDPAAFERMMAVHLLGAVYTMQAVLPSMIERGAGRVVNIASIAGLGGAPNVSAYAAAKHALVGLTRCVALEMAPRGIAIDAVCPGYTDTDLVSDAVDRAASRTGRDPREIVQALLDGAAQTRMITPAEVAQTVLALCCAPAGAASGRAILVDTAEQPFHSPGTTT